MNIARNYLVEAHILMVNQRVIENQGDDELTKNIERLTDRVLKEHNCLVGIQVRKQVGSDWIDDGVESETVSVLRDYLDEHPDLDPKNVRLTVVYTDQDEEE